MIKEEFVELTKAERAVLLLNTGEKISSRNNDGFDIVLVLIDNLFAELWYHENTDKIVRVEIIEIEMVLNNYPELVNSSFINEALI